MIIAIVAIVIVVAVVLAAVVVMSPKDPSQSTPQAALNAYVDGVKEHNASKLVDSTILHFDSTNRSMYIANVADQWANVSMLNISIVSMEDIFMVNVPADIKLDVTNFTTHFQNLFGVTIQESQFIKVTVNRTYNSTYSNTSTAYTMFSKVDGKWYYDLNVSYTVEDWAADRSKSDQGVRYDSGPIGSFTYAYGTNNWGYWVFTLGSIGSSTLNYTDCKVQLTVGSHVSNAIAIPTSRYVTIPIIAGKATGYDLAIIDYGTSGYLSRNDNINIGPINNATGKNAFQPVGTQVTLTLIYTSTGETIATKTITLQAP